LDTLDWSFLKSKNRFWSLTGGCIKYQRASFDPKPSFKNWKKLTLINDQFLLVISWVLWVLWSFSNTQNWRSFWLLKTSKNQAKGCEDLNFFILTNPPTGGPFGFWKHQRAKPRMWGSEYFLFKKTPELEVVWFLKF
jgi:hypothetical protein